MKQIEINGEKYLLLVNNRVHTLLRTEFNVDPFNTKQKVDWMDDPDVVERIGYLSAVEGAKLKGEKLELSQDQFGAYLTGEAAMDILSIYMESVTRWAEHIMENTEKKQNPGKK